MILLIILFAWFWYDAFVSPFHGFNDLGQSYPALHSLAYARSLRLGYYVLRFQRIKILSYEVAKDSSPGLSERERAQAWVKVERKFEALKGRDKKILE